MFVRPSTERVVARNFLKLGSGELVARVTGYLVLVYIARELGASAYGTIGYAQAIVLYVASLVDYGIESVGPREVAAQPDDAGRIVSSVLSVRLLIATAGAGILAAVGLGVLPDPDGVVLALFGLTLFSVALSTRWVHIGFERTGPVAVARTLGELLKAAIILWLVRDASDILYVVAAYVAGDLLSAGVMLYRLRAYSLPFRFQIDGAAVRPVLRASSPLVVVAISGMLIYNADLVMLRFFIGREAAGFYLAAYTLITLVSNLGAAYQSTLLPALSRAEQSVSGRLALYQTSLAQVFAATLPLAVGGFLLAPAIVRFWFGEAFQPSNDVLRVLVLTIPLAMLRLMQHAALIATGRQREVMWATGAAALLNVALNLAVIPHYGMIGASLATLGTEVVRSILAQHFSHRAEFFWPSLARLWPSSVAAVAMAGLLVWVEPVSMWTGLALGGGSYLFTLMLCGGLAFREGRPVLTV